MGDFIRRCRFRRAGRRAGRAVAALILCFVLAPQSPWAAQNTPVNTPPLEISALQRAECLAFDARTASRTGTGNLRFVGTESGRPIPHPRPLQAAVSAEAAAASYLSVCGSMLGLKTTGQALVAYDTSQPDPGRTVVRLQVMEQGIPVIGSEFIVHLDATRNVLAVTGETVPRTGIVTTVTVSPAEAIATARDLVSKSYQVDPDALTVTTPELWIYDPELIGPGGGFPTTVWRMEVTPTALLPIREFVLVETQRGAVVLHFNQVETALDRETYTAGNTTVLPGTLVCDEANPSCAGGDAEAVAAHIYAGDTYNFYLTNHGRDSLDGAGMTLVSTVHYDVGFNNAFWNGSQMVYGDGVGFALADDVVGHELTHGVTQHTSNLFYYYQSGAINESFSDIWGEFVDQTNLAGNDSAAVKWLIGEDVTGLGAIRDMEGDFKGSSQHVLTGVSVAVR